MNDILKEGTPKAEAGLTAAKNALHRLYPSMPPEHVDGVLDIHDESIIFGNSVPDDQTLRRWTRNYIRHELSDYEEYLEIDIERDIARNWTGSERRHIENKWALPQISLKNRTNQGTEIAYYGGSESQPSRVPIYTTPYRDGAQWYATENEANTGVGKVHELIITAKNPLELYSEKDFTEKWIPLLQEANIPYKFTPTGGKKGTPFETGWQVEIPMVANFSPYDGYNAIDASYIPAFRDVLIKHGYDSIKSKDMLERTEIPVTILIKDPSQAESSKLTTVYRGGPHGEGDFPGVFVSKSRAAAEQYGDVSEHQIDMSKEKILDINSKETENLVKRYEIWNPDDLALVNNIPEDLFMFPSPGWKQFLEHQGYTGTSIGDDIFLFNEIVRETDKGESGIPN